MPINTLAYATLFQQQLDQQMIEGATSGWMESNAGQVIYNGGNEVKIPKIVWTVSAITTVTTAMCRAL